MSHTEAGLLRFSQRLSKLADLEKDALSNRQSLLKELEMRDSKQEIDATNRVTYSYTLKEYKQGNFFGYSNISVYSSASCRVLRLDDKSYYTMEDPKKPRPLRKYLQDSVKIHR